MNAQHTPGPWEAQGIGGASVVISKAMPRRSDTRIPPYAYNAERGYSIAYPFIGDDKQTARLDFVCFNHADARLIAAAPDLLLALEMLLDWHVGQCPEDEEYSAVRDARAAIAKATGNA